MSTYQHPNLNLARSLFRPIHVHVHILKPEPELGDEAIDAVPNRELETDDQFRDRDWESDHLLDGDSPIEIYPSQVRQFPDIWTDFKASIVVFQRNIHFLRREKKKERDK